MFIFVKILINVSIFLVHCGADCSKNLKKFWNTVSSLLLNITYFIFYDSYFFSQRGLKINFNRTSGRKSVAVNVLIIVEKKTSRRNLPTGPVITANKNLKAYFRAFGSATTTRPSVPSGRNLF